jgi:malate dehydrogenase (oxaloacetate-decarboxylating)(NADP+)
LYVLPVQLLQRLGDAELVGPMLAGVAAPGHVSHRADEVNGVVDSVAVAW